MGPKGENTWYCPSCEQDYYNNPKPCVELAIFNHKGEVLLSERAHEPHKGKYDMPGGFIDMGETAEEAVLREVDEELELKPGEITQPRFVRTYIAPYPWGRETYQNIILLFAATLKTNRKIIPRDDVASVKWVTPNDVRVDELSISRLFNYIQEAKQTAKA